MISIFNAEEGISRFLVHNFLAQKFEKFCWEKIWCIRKVRVTKHLFLHEKGMSRFYIENLLSQSPEKHRGGTIQCFTKLRVSKFFMYKKGISLFSVETFLFHSAEKVVEEPFCTSEEFQDRKI